MIFLREKESKRKIRQIHLFTKKHPGKFRYSVSHLANSLKSCRSFEYSVFFTVEVLKIAITHGEGSHFWHEKLL